jgi:iron complex transport system substrate-binding protein
MYNGTFKTLHITDGDSKTASYILNQCGATLPPSLDLDSYAAVIEIPLTSAAFTQTSSLPFFEMLGVRDAIHKLTVPLSELSSPCLRKGVETNIVEDGDWSDNTLDVDVEVTFGGKWSDQTNLTDADSFFVPFDEWSESSILAQEEYLKLAAVFFNKEKEANEIFDGIQKRIDCVSNNVNEYLKFHDEVYDLNIIWAYYSTWVGYEGWSVGQCKPCDSCVGGQGPYYCETAFMLGVTIPEIGESYDGYSMLTNEQFEAYGKDADVWFYGDTNFDTVLADTENFGFLSNFKAVQDKQVFDIQGLGAKDFHEGRAAELDVLVEDMAKATFSSGFPASELMNFEHSLVWFRNVFTSEIGTREEMCTTEEYSAALQPQANQCTLKTYVEIFEPNGGAAGTSASTGLAVGVALAAAATLAAAL